MLPETRLAQRLVERRGLVPPIDVDSLLRDYATVEYVEFPVPIDGLCLGLKAIGRKPTVLINRSSPSARRRFTLAHELGHVLIPWHVGNIIDEIDVVLASGESYFEVESEANRFASELLMPHLWVEKQISSSSNPLDALFEIADKAAVSLTAASIKLMDCLPPNYVLATSGNGVVDRSSRSKGTLAATIARGTNLHETNPYPFPCRKWTRLRQGTTFSLWQFDTLTDLHVPVDDRPWRDILDEIVSDIIPDETDGRKFKASVNGVTSYANGAIRVDRRPNTIATAMLQRLHAAAVTDWRFREFLDHECFPMFCSARARAYAER
jgi:hypothetical protein